MNFNLAISLLILDFFMMITGSSLMNTTTRQEQLRILVQELSTLAQLGDQLPPLTEIRVGLNPSLILRDEESILQQPIKKSEQTSTLGLDLELKRLQRSSSKFLAIWYPCYHNIPNKQCPVCLFSHLAQIQSENLKPIVGKKRVSPKPKT